MYTMIIAKRDGKSQTAEKAIAALKWLKKNNHLYKKFYSNMETIFSFYSSIKSKEDQCFSPVYGPDFQPRKTLKEKTDLLNSLKMGLVIPVNDEESAVPSTFGIHHQKKVETLQSEIEFIRSTWLSHNDPTLEAKCWPWLLPFGKGGWGPNTLLNRLEYGRFRIANYWSKFRQESSYVFVWLDINIKRDIESFNSLKVITEAKQVKALTVQDIEDENPYKRYGREVPRQVPNSSK